MAAINLNDGSAVSYRANQRAGGYYVGSVGTLTGRDSMGWRTERALASTRRLYRSYSSAYAAARRLAMRIAKATK